MWTALLSVLARAAPAVARGAAATEGAAAAEGATAAESGPTLRTAANVGSQYLNSRHENTGLQQQQVRSSTAIVGDAGAGPAGYREYG